MSETLEFIATICKVVEYAPLEIEEIKADELVK